MKGVNVISVIIGVAIVVIFLSLLPSKCRIKGCNNNTYGDSRYCKEHDWSDFKSKYSKTNRTTSSTKKTGTTSSTANTTSSSKTSSSSKNNVSSKKTSSSKKSTSSKKKSMPDCDDYDSYDDFMDDWDGCMPDGSDAEDYWEDW